MLKIFGNLRNYLKYVAVIFLLLVAQAYCELQLPAYTSDIVNVGIARSGVEDTVPKYLSYETAVSMQMANGTSTLFADSYELEERDGNAYFVLKENADIGALESAVAAFFPDMTADNLNAALGQFCISEYGKVGIDLSKMQLQYVLKVGARMLLLSLAAMACTIMVGFFAARTAAGVGRDLRRKVFTKVVGFSNAEIEKFQTASLITRSTNDIQQIQMVTVILLRMVLYAPILGIGGVMKVLNTNTSMSYIIAVAVVCVSGVVLLLFVIAMPKFELMQKLVDRVNLVAREILTGLSVIRAFSRESYEEKRFDKANTDLMETQLFTNRAMNFMMPVMMLIMNGVSVAIVWFGGKGVDAGSLQVGDMIAFMTYAMQIIMSFLMLTMVSIMLPRAGVAAKRIDEVLKTAPGIPNTDTPVEKDYKGEVEFHDVSFAYPDAKENVLEHISFTAKPGETTAFIGSTGSGKSTLVNLIPRFYDVTEGSITVDGVNIKDMDKKKLRSIVGYVPQKAVLFSGTIRSNILYGSEESGDGAMTQAARISQSEEFILAKEKTYDSGIAQGGANVSGGQKQRLSIARAIAKNPKIYIFDDSFSALDFKTDAVLRKELSKVTAEAAVLIVAQRVSTILHAQKIIVLDEGKIVGMGTHRELMKNNDVYRQIAASQLSQADIEATLL